MANIVLVALIPILVVVLGNALGGKEATGGQNAGLTALASQAPGGTGFGMNPFNISSPVQPAASSYEVTGTSSVQVGVDVSEHQGAIDWPKVAQNGIEFAFIRVGARGYAGGNIISDTQYQANMQGAKAAGLKVGVYFFSQATSAAEAEEEADFVLAALNGQVLDLPVVYDFETVDDSQGRANNLSSVERSIDARAFAERIEAAGYRVMIYGNAKDLLMYDLDLRSKYQFWFAEYNVLSPSYYGFDFAFWQFTSSGVIAGINTLVDLNIDFSTLGPNDQKALPGNVVVHQGSPPGQ
ncbi:MAG: glycoside hydrolase family 25 protein [Coriobacteriia bacterium]|nr:glycoside hydrolase family 25 protein [Coriobacteriia bacterium]